MSEEDFRLTFSQFGKLKEGYISKKIRASSQMQVSSYFGFVTFEDPMVAQRILEMKFVKFHASMAGKIDIPDFRSIKRKEWAERMIKDPHF